MPEPEVTPCEEPETQPLDEYHSDSDEALIQALEQAAEPLISHQPDGGDDAPAVKKQRTC